MFSFGSICQTIGVDEEKARRTLAEHKERGSWPPDGDLAREFRRKQAEEASK